MRLIRLKITNIASLKGEHQINFQNIEKESSLFAITGETGSGKSTILNAIGLALYGQIYKRNLNQLDVVTLGEKEGSIELIFQVKNKHYLAEWNAKVLKQNGEPYSSARPPQRHLYSLEGNNFGDQKTISQTTSAELLNLDFDQFCKCIILNQGEFARFLTSTFTERKLILEKLYPGELLDSISKELDQEKKRLERELDALNVELQTLKGNHLPGGNLKEQKNQVLIKLQNLENETQTIDTLDSHFSNLFSYYKRYHENLGRKKITLEDLTEETKNFNILLKKGELFFHELNLAKEKQDKEIPILQKFLEKEGTLNLLEENLKKTKEKITHYSSLVENLSKDIHDNKNHETIVNQKLATLSQDLSFSVKDLEAAQDRLPEIFDLFSEKEILNEEIKGKKIKIDELASRGSDVKIQIHELQNKLTKIPTDIFEMEKNILQEKNIQLQLHEQKQRALINFEENQKQIKISQSNILKNKNLITNLLQKLKIWEQEILPLEATLKLSQVIAATQTCLNHVLSSNEKHCPVCETKIEEKRWSDIKKRLDAANLEEMESKLNFLKKEVFKSQHDIDLLKERIQQDQTIIREKEDLLSRLAVQMNQKVTPLEELDRELQEVRKQGLEFLQLSKENSSKNKERDELRTLFKKVQDDLRQREVLLKEKEKNLQELSESVANILPVLNRDAIRDLKTQLRQFNLFKHEEASLIKIKSEREFLLARVDDNTKELQSYQKVASEELKEISNIRFQLQQALKDQKASQMIKAINDEVKKASDSWSDHLVTQNKQEQILRSLQGKIYTLEELSNDLDLHFQQELELIKKLGERISDENDGPLSKLSHLDLSFDSPLALYLPLENLIKDKKTFLKKESDECRMLIAGLNEKISAWEKLQDKIELAELKYKDTKEALEKKVQLFEILGKDELRNFVLSLVEENLIFQTNLELQKLCQGRYEIIHQTKSMRMSPEFFILDKYKDARIRKVSTLSGGETFMVSLGMALGLAEMTRGRAEIDSLFIDEGFGSLDQESLEDVLNMLGQIQTRGLMVGVISHIKTLTDSIPVNLVLDKKQDGTSSVSMRVN